MWKSSFTYLNEAFHFKVIFSNYSTMNVMGKGAIKKESKNGFIEIISNVLYVLDFENKLLC